MGRKMLNVHTCLFSIVSPQSQLWGLDGNNPDDNAIIVLGTNTGRQTQKWVLDLIEF
jgi:hypothetical protein